MLLDEGTTLLFIGDSITDRGRARPVGRRDGLGDGYVALANGLLSAVYSERRIRVLNTGISGNTVLDLQRRWQTDVLDLAPDWLSVMIGINDVWRQFDSDLDPDQVDIARYESVYRSLLDRTRRSLKGLVLMTPYFLEAERTDPMRAQMDAYGAVVRRLAAEFEAVLVDTQEAFDRYLALRPAQSLCGDRVHPNLTGHTILALAFLRAIGFAWPMPANGFADRP